MVPADPSCHTYHGFITVKVRGTPLAFGSSGQTCSWCWRSFFLSFFFFLRCKKGREFRLRIGAPPEDLSLSKATLEVCPELERIISSSNHLIQRRLTVAVSIHEFLTEFVEIIVRPWWDSRYWAPAFHEGFLVRCSHAPPLW